MIRPHTTVKRKIELNGTGDRSKVSSKYSYFLADTRKKRKEDKSKS